LIGRPALGDCRATRHRTERVETQELWGNSGKPVSVLFAPGALGVPIFGR
jgi:hypothetical protein